MSGSTIDPPWLAPQLDSLSRQRGHAWLLQGPSGLGQFELALALASAWLCDAPQPLPQGGQGACGQCSSCHLLEAHTHPDLALLMPETDMLERGWALSEKAQREIDDKKRKPSRQIRVEAMLEAVEFSQRTSARGRGKALLVYPAERMNVITANALLKTLEEPPGDMRFVLASEAADQLLPTIRSRCITHTMVWPEPATAEAWLAGQGVAADTVHDWLRAAGGRPAEAQRMAGAGLPPSFWRGLPRALARGDGSAMADWAPAQVVDALQKICHDLWVLRVGGQPRYFAPEDLPAPPGITTLAHWSKALTASARTAEHPFNAGLMLEALVSEAQRALHSRA